MNDISPCLTFVKDTLSSNRKNTIAVICVSQLKKLRQTQGKEKTNKQIKTQS